MSNNNLRIQYVSDLLHEIYKNEGVESQDFMKKKIKEIINKYPQITKSNPDSFSKEIRLNNIEPDEVVKIKNIASYFGITIRSLIHYELFSEGSI